MVAEVAETRTGMMTVVGQVPGIWEGVIVIVNEEAVIMNDEACPVHAVEATRGGTTREADAIAGELPA